MVQLEERERGREGGLDAGVGDAKEGGREGGQIPVGGEEEDVGAGGVHLVGLAGVDGLLLHVLDLEGVQLLVEHLGEGGREGGREGGGGGEMRFSKHVSRGGRYEGQNDGLGMANTI